MSAKGSLPLVKLVMKHSVLLYLVKQAFFITLHNQKNIVSYLADNL